MNKMTGFTLIESVLSLLLILVITTAMIRLHLFISQLNQKYITQQKTLLIAQNVMTELYYNHYIKTFNVKNKQVPIVTTYEDYNVKIDKIKLSQLKNEIIIYSVVITITKIKQKTNGDNGNDIVTFKRILTAVEH